VAGIGAIALAVAGFAEMEAPVRSGVAVAAAAMLLVGALDDHHGWLARVLSLPTGLSWLGNRAYGLYLIYSPVYGYLARTDTAVRMGVAVGAAIVLPLAWEPCLASQSTPDVFKRHWLLSCALLMGALFICCTWTLHILDAHLPASPKP